MTGFPLVEIWHAARGVDATGVLQVRVPELLQVRSRHAPDTTFGSLCKKAQRSSIICTVPLTTNN